MRVASSVLQVLEFPLEGLNLLGLGLPAMCCVCAALVVGTMRAGSTCIDGGGRLWTPIASAAVAQTVRGGGVEQTTMSVSHCVTLCEALLALLIHTC